MRASVDTVAVIIPSFNRARTLSRALDSVLAQSLPADEIIVIDDGSIDATTDVLAAYGAQIRCFSQENGGVSKARNTAAAQTQCQWLAFLDSDDEWLPSKLALQLQAVQTHPECQFFHTDEIWVRNGVRVNPKFKHKKPDGNAFEASLALCCVSPSTVLIRRDLFLAHGGFDENLAVCEDYDLWLRLFAQHSVHLVDELLTIKYGGHEDQLSHQYWGMDRFRVKTLVGLLSSGVLTTDQTQQTLALLLSKCALLEQGFKKRGKIEELVYYQNLRAQWS